MRMRAEIALKCWRRGTASLSEQQEETEQDKHSNVHGTGISLHLGVQLPSPRTPERSPKGAGSQLWTSLLLSVLAAVAGDTRGETLCAGDPAEPQQNHQLVRFTL